MGGSPLIFPFLVWVSLEIPDQTHIEFARVTFRKQKMAKEDEQILHSDLSLKPKKLYKDAIYCLE